MSRRLAAVSVFAFLLSDGVLAVGGNQAEYVGGTVQLREKADGMFDTSSPDVLVFKGDKTKDGTLSIPYSAVTELEYGQKAGRRVAVAVLVTPFALFSKKRNHFLTLNFKDDDGKEQAAVFELGKDIIRTTLEILKVRTGKPIECQDQEAKKDYGGCIVVSDAAPAAPSGSQPSVVLTQPLVRNRQALNDRSASSLRPALGTQRSWLRSRPASGPA